VDGLGRPLATAGGTALVPTLGLESTLGHAGGDAVAAELAGGAVVSGGTTPVARAVLAADTWALRARGEAAALGGSSRGAVTVASLHVGPRRGLTLGGGLEGRAGVEPLAAGALAPGPLGVGSSGWLEREGWTGHVDAHTPLGGGLSLDAYMYWDFTAARRLAEQAVLRYAHACGCLGMVALVSHRAGREGVDAQLALSLF
jgi:hypothetical protein